MKKTSFGKVCGMTRLLTDHEYEKQEEMVLSPQKIKPINALVFFHFFSTSVIR